MSFNKVLIPLDGSKLAERALAPALALADAFSAEIVLLRVVVPLSINLDPDLYQRVINRGQKEAKSYLNSIQMRSHFSAANLKSETMVGKAAESIINYAEENEIDLIVMSSHGRSGVERWILGSVTEKTLRGAHCATMVIR